MEANKPKFIFLFKNGGGARNLKKTTTNRFSKYEESELAVIDFYTRNEIKKNLELYLFCYSI
jgi:hypothetical protein